MSNIHVHLPAALLRKPVWNTTKDASSEIERAERALAAQAQLISAYKSKRNTPVPQEMLQRRDMLAEELEKLRAKAQDESPETKERHEGALNEKETAMASEHVEHREDTPASVFLMPAARKYPVKTKQDGEYKYDRGLLLAAAREARMHGHGALADRADAIREREFGAKDTREQRFGLPVYTEEEIKQKIRKGEWEAETDVAKGKRVELRQGKRRFQVYVKE